MSNNTSIKKTLDWRFWIALSLFALVAWLVTSSFIALSQSDAKDERIDTLISGIQHQEAVAADERLQAANERAALLEYTRALAQRQREILAYLNKHGIELPTRLLQPITAPRMAMGDANAGKKSSRPHHQAQRPQQRHGKPSSPGKSGGKSQRPAHAGRH